MNAPEAPRPTYETHDIPQAFDVSGDQLTDEREFGAGLDIPGDTPLAEFDDREDITLQDLSPVILSVLSVSQDNYALYIRDVCAIRNLTEWEEQDLGRRKYLGEQARKEFAETSNPKRQKQLCTIIEDGLRASDQFVLSNQRLVISIAKKYRGMGLPFLDLIQAGNIGLIRGTKKFDSTRGHKFSTYATWWIRQAIMRSISEDSRLIRVPVILADKIRNLIRTKDRLVQKLGHDPTTQDLADATGAPEKTIQLMLRTSQIPYSLETPVREGEPGELLGEALEDTETVLPEEYVIRADRRKQISKVLDEALPCRYARVLKLLHGVPDGLPLSQTAVGEKFGVTFQRIGQIEARAYEMLRGNNEAMEALQDYVDFIAE